MPIITYTKREKHGQQQGFTMVVIAALFIAFAVIGAAAVERNTTTQQITRRDAAVAQLNRLSAAIIEYSVFSGGSGSTLLYPCPASPTEAFNTANFGKAVAGCATGTPAGLTILSGGTQTLRGVVPVQELSGQGINANDMFDPWNNRIMYIVNRELTVGSTTSGTATRNAITLNDAGSNVTLASPDFILISYGRDGIGATKATNTTVSITCDAASTLRRLENCDDDTNFVIAPTYTASDAADGTYFDDILTYYRQ